MSVALRRIEGFQSTSPVWRTTIAALTTAGRKNDFNPRPPCGGRLLHIWRVFTVDFISIHVPRVEDDFHPSVLREVCYEFQSTSPVWRTTSYLRKPSQVPRHFNPRPRVEDDYFDKVFYFVNHHFNPRPPCGGRLNSTVPIIVKSIFQSTSPVWRTTNYKDSSIQ